MALTPRFRNLLRVARDALLLGLPVLPYIVMIGLFRRGDGAFDMHVFWVAAQSVAHGDSPYDPAGVAHARALIEAHPHASASTAWAVYPPAAYLPLIPLGLLPWHVAAAIGVAGVAAAGFVALRVMGVRDWRCYLVAFGSAPLATSILEGAISTVLMLAVALVWKGRATVAASAAAIVAKLFAWPLAFVVGGLYGSRRAALLLGSAFAVALGSWTVIGFSDLLAYPGMLQDLSAAEAQNSFSAGGLAYALGAPAALGGYVGLVAGLATALLAWRAARRGNRDAAFTLAIVAALVASPIVWAHYLVLLFLPIAARSPRFSALWLAPLPIWLGYPIGANGHILAFVCSWPCIAIIVIAALRRTPVVADGELRELATSRRAGRIAEAGSRAA
jgi:alpha-1,2-mannosyltransferase